MKTKILKVVLFIINGVVLLQAAIFCALVCLMIFTYVFLTFDLKYSIYKMTNNIEVGMAIEDFTANVTDKYRIDNKNATIDNRIGKITNRVFTDYDEVISVRGSGLIVIGVCYILFEDNKLIDSACGQEQTFI